MTKYAGNLIGGLAMNVIGPRWALLGLNAVVVFVGFLILSGAVNTAIVGSNGVLNRVSEDGVLPDWFLKPHLKYGTTYRLINTVAGLQIFTIVASRGNVLTLGEAYAFGVVWSFVFKALSMLVLRFKQPGHREYEVPFNFRAGKFDVPLGIIADLPGARRRRARQPPHQGSGDDHRDRRSPASCSSSSSSASGPTTSGWDRPSTSSTSSSSTRRSPSRSRPRALNLTKPYRKLVAIRSPYNLGMLEKCLNETDPETTEVVVMTATAAASRRALTSSPRSATRTGTC